MTRKIQFKHYPPTRGNKMSTLLFVHGGYVDSTCWDFNFVPYFRARGYACTTVDLSGHGGSDGRDRIDDFGIDDYVDDLRAAVEAIGVEPIIVGHSMGARVVERYLEQESARAAIFLSPVPATGTSSSAISLALRYPEFFEALDEAISGDISPRTAELMTRVYFSPKVSPDEAAIYLPMLGAESHRAILELTLPETRSRVQRQKLPCLVVGGTEDIVFPASMLHFMATSWQADILRVEGAGHMLMLDPQWATLAEQLLAWLDAKACD